VRDALGISLAHNHKQTQIFVKVIVWRLCCTKSNFNCYCLFFWLSLITKKCVCCMLKLAMHVMCIGISECLEIVFGKEEHEWEWTVGDCGA